MELCCGGFMDHGQLKQLPLSSHPPPSHLLSHQTWPSETDCRPALSVCCGFGKWQRGDMKEGDGERKAQIQLRGKMVKKTWFDSIHADVGRQRRGQRRGGEELQRRAVQSWNLNSCQTIVSEAAPPAAVLVIFPTARSPSTSVLIPLLMPIWSLKQRSFLSPKKNLATH